MHSILTKVALPFGELISHMVRFTTQVSNLLSILSSELSTENEISGHTACHKGLALILSPPHWAGTNLTPCALDLYLASLQEEEVNCE